MKRLVIIPLLAAFSVFSAGLAQAQSASPEETAVVSKIAGCLSQGAPEDWQTVSMIVELAKPGDDSGDVRYLASRAGTAELSEPYQPCDIRGPALALLDIRDSQPPEKRGWTVARIVLERSGRFRLNFEYPQR